MRSSSCSSSRSRRRSSRRSSGSSRSRSSSGSSRRSRGSSRSSNSSSSSDHQYQVYPHFLVIVLMDTDSNYISLFFGGRSLITLGSFIILFCVDACSNSTSMNVLYCQKSRWAQFPQGSAEYRAHSSRCIVCAIYFGITVDEPSRQNLGT